MPVIFHMCYVSDAEDKMVSQTFFLPSRSFSRAINGLEIQYLHSHLRAGLNLQPTPRTTGFTGTKPAEMVPASVLPPPQSFNESSAFCNKCCLLSILIPAPCSCSHIPFFTVPSVHMLCSWCPPVVSQECMCIFYPTRVSQLFESRDFCLLIYTCLEMSCSASFT